MSKKHCSKTVFNTESVKEARTLLKSARHHLYHLFSSIGKKLRGKMSLLVIRECLGLFVNTLTADGKYSLCNRRDFTATN